MKPTPEQILAQVMGITETDVKEYDAVPKKAALSAIRRAYNEGAIESLQKAKILARESLSVYNRDDTGEPKSDLSRGQDCTI